MHENVKKNILLLSIVALLIIVPIAAQFVSMDRHFPLPTEDSVQSVAVVRSSEGYSDELTVKDEASIRLIYSELSSMRFKRSDKMLPAGGTLYEITLAIKDGTHESMS